VVAEGTAAGSRWVLRAIHIGNTDCISVTFHGQSDVLTYGPACGFGVTHLDGALSVIGTTSEEVVPPHLPFVAGARRAGTTVATVTGEGGERVEAMNLDDGLYVAFTSTRPQTISYSVADKERSCTILHGSHSSFDACGS
jgi:hypothetical protein